jgi:hypothetical protein
MMSETIPEDIHDDALGVCKELGLTPRPAHYGPIQAALLSERIAATEAERERCAEIADVVSDEKDVMALESNGNTNIAAYREGERTATRIAAAIRSQP